MSRRRLEWQDITPRERELRTAYHIAAKNQHSFVRAINRYFADLTTPEALQAFQREMRPEDMPFESAGERLRRSLERIFANVVEASGRAEGRRGVEIPDGILETIRKARVGYSFDLDNPYSIPWIREHVGELIVNISEEQMQAVRDIVREGFESGSAPRIMAQQIKERIGLLPKDIEATRRTFRSTEEQAIKDGFTRKQAREIARRVSAEQMKKLRKRRAENIARTETIGAEAKGLEDAWLSARGQGLMMPQAVKIWIASPQSPRTCAICLQLDAKYGTPDKGIPLDESFTWQVGNRSGAITRPTAHPSCRCTMGLWTAA